LSTDGITTSQLSSVINMIQQAQNANSNANSNSMSSLDQRLSLMSNSGQFGLALNENNQVFYDPTYQACYNSSVYSDQYYGPQDASQAHKIDSQPTENLEPADMDLGDSDDDDSAKKQTLDKNSIEDKLKRKPMEMPFMNPQDLSGLFPLIPPPPPPPMPPAVLKDLFVPPTLEEDPFFHAIPPMAGLDGNHIQGNSIRNMADRPSRNSVPYHANHGSNNWRNSSDSRQPSRSQNFNSSHHNSNHNSRWKNNNNRGSWKRNSYGSHH